MSWWDTCCLADLLQCHYERSVKLILCNNVQKLVKILCLSHDRNLLKAEFNENLIYIPLVKIKALEFQEYALTCYPRSYNDNRVKSNLSAHVRELQDIAFELEKDALIDVGDEFTYKIEYVANGLIFCEGIILVISHINEFMVIEN